MLLHVPLFGSRTRTYRSTSLRIRTRPAAQKARQAREWRRRADPPFQITRISIAEQLGLVHEKNELHRRQSSIVLGSRLRCVKQFQALRPDHRRRTLLECSAEQSVQYARPDAFLRCLPNLFDQPEKFIDVFAGARGADEHWCIVEKEKAFTKI